MTTFFAPNTTPALLEFAAELQLIALPQMNAMTMELAMLELVFAISHTQPKESLVMMEVFAH
jgi:hypothetical protein